MKHSDTYWNQLVQQEFEEKLDELDMLIERKKADESFSLENYVPDDVKKKKKKKEQFSLQMGADDLRKLFAVIKSKVADLEDKYNTLTSAKKKDKEKLMFQLLTENSKACEVFTSLRSDCKRNRVAHDNRVVKSDPARIIGSSIVLLCKYVDEYINVAYGTLKSLPVAGCETVQVEIKDCLKHQNLFTDTIMNAGSIIDYPWSLLSKDKTEEGININNLLLSNPPPSRRSITPVNNLLVFSTPNVDSTANTSLGSSGVDLTPSVGLDSALNSSSATSAISNSSATSAAIVDLNSVAELPPPPIPPPTISVDLNSTGGTVNPTSSAVSVVVATPVVGLGSSTLPTDSFVGNLNSNTTMVESTPFVRGNDKSNELGDPSTTIDDGPIVVEEPTSLSSAHLHIVTALFQGTDIYVPTSSKPYWAFRAVEAKRLIDNNFALAQHNAYLEKQVKEDSIFQDSITKLVEAKNASRKNTSPIVTTVDLMFDGMTRTVSHEEFEKFKNSSKINETIDQVMQWFDLVEDDLKSKKKEFDTFLLQYKGCKMADSTIRNRVPYARKRDAALASSSTGTSEPPKKARKKSPNSASSSSDDGGDAHSPASNAPHQ